MFVWVIKMIGTIRQMKIKNCPDYFFNNSIIINIKDFDPSLLEITKLSFNGVLSLNIYYIKYIPKKSINHVTVDNDKVFLYLCLDDVHGHNGESNGIEYLVFTPTEYNKETLKNHEKTLGRN